MAKKTANSRKKSIAKGRRVKTAQEIKLEIESKCLSIRTLISSTATMKLNHLQPLFSNAMADELGYNHGRFLNKLRNPIKFTMTEIHRFANYTGCDVERLTKRINEEIKTNNALSSTLNKFKSVEKLKRYNKTGKTNK